LETAGAFESLDAFRSRPVVANSVIASEAKQSIVLSNERMDCFVAFHLRSLSFGGRVAPRNHGT
jgi:hypothetical protein